MFRGYATFAIRGSHQRLLRSVRATDNLATSLVALRRSAISLSPRLRSNVTTASIDHYLAEAGVYTVRGRILDKDGGFTDFWTDIEILGS